jgi:hypothetical protein
MGNTPDWELVFPPFTRHDPMKIDIDKLSESELIELNHRIVARLRFLNQMRVHLEMLEFKIGDRVGFQPPGKDLVEGMLTRYNKMTGGSGTYPPAFSAGLGRLESRNSPTPRSSYSANADATNRTSRPTTNQLSPSEYRRPRGISRRHLHRHISLVLCGPVRTGYTPPGQLKKRAGRKWASSVLRRPHTISSPTSARSGLLQPSTAIP